MDWFRLYSSVRQDPKVMRLDPPAFRAWIVCLCLASEHDPRGCLPPVPEVAWALQVSDAEGRALLDTLQAAGLLDEHEGCLRPHNWEGRQRDSDSAAQRMRAYRERLRNGDVTPSLSLSSSSPREREIKIKRALRNGDGTDVASNGHDARTGATWGANGQSGAAQKAEFAALIAAELEKARRQRASTTGGDGGAALPRPGDTATG
jgi:hypothetical protein